MDHEGRGKRGPQPTADNWAKIALSSRSFYCYITMCSRQIIKIRMRGNGPRAQGSTTNEPAHAARTESDPSMVVAHEKSTTPNATRR